MLETLKKWGTGLTLGVKDLFTSPESQVYVKELRKVMMYDGRKCKYPKNYDQVVKSGKIIKNEDMSGKPVLDKDKKSTYKLLYGPKDKNGEQPSFELTKVTEIASKSYFTISFLVSKGRREVDDYRGFYEPFRFSKISLEKHIPVFEVDLTSFKLTNSSLLAKKGCSINDKTGEVDEKDRDEKGRNGKLLYTSDYKKLNTSFFEVRDQNNNLELDKSLISVPIVLVTGFARVCAKLLTSLPMKLGEHLISEQNPIAKSFGYLLFTPAAAVKNLVNIGATILKAPILLFVANEKKYGDAYFTMWKHQLKECWQETKNDYSVIKDDKRSKQEQKDYLVCEISGTWDELNARKLDIERDLKKGLNESSESMDKPVELEKSDINNNLLKKQLQNKDNGKTDAAVNRKSSTPHADEVLSRRNSLQDGKTL